MPERIRIVKPVYGLLLPGVTFVPERERRIKLIEHIRRIMDHLFAEPEILERIISFMGLKTYAGTLIRIAEATVEEIIKRELIKEYEKAEAEAKAEKEKIENQIRDNFRRVEQMIERAREAGEITAEKYKDLKERLKKLRDETFDLLDPAFKICGTLLMEEARWERELPEEARKYLHKKRAEGSRDFAKAVSEKATVELIELSNEVIEAVTGIKIK